MGLGAYFGYFVRYVGDAVERRISGLVVDSPFPSQNGRGHVLGHVKDLGEDATQKDRVRIYRTNAKYASSRLASDISGDFSADASEFIDNTFTPTAPTSSASSASPKPSPAANPT
jgi:hypothetical protein